MVAIFNERKFLEELSKATELPTERCASLLDLAMVSERDHDPNPCPFCKRRDRVIIEQRVMKHGWRTTPVPEYRVRCTRIPCRIDSLLCRIVYRDSDSIGWSRDSAVIIWNQNRIATKWRKIE